MAIERPATPPRVASMRSAKGAAGRASPRWRPPSRASAGRARDPTRRCLELLGEAASTEPEAGAHVLRTDPGSSPIVSSTGPMSAPARSARPASSLANEIFRARYALAPFLMSSASSRVTRRTGEPGSRTPRPARERGAIGRRGRSDDDPMWRAEVAQRRALGEELGDREEAHFVDHVAVAEETLAGPHGRRAAHDRDGLWLEGTDLGQDRFDGATSA